VAQRPSLIIAFAAVLLIGGCDRSSARPSGPRTGAPTYRLGQAWDEPANWRIKITGMRCGRASDLDHVTYASEDPDRQDICLVHVTFTNREDRARSFSGTDGPTWRVVGFDTGGHEFHGHARRVNSTARDRTGRTDLVFEVATGLRLHRLLLGGTMVTLAG
jgi:hypothetical protein